MLGGIPLQRQGVRREHVKVPALEEWQHQGGQSSLLLARLSLGTFEAKQTWAFEAT